MNSKKLLIPLFILMIAAQLFVTGKMVLDSENILKNGKTFKFKTVPVDPTDPFRGKYVALNFEANEVEINSYFRKNETIFAKIIKDENGFAEIYGLYPIKNEQGSKRFNAKNIAKKHKTANDILEVKVIRTNLNSSTGKLDSINGKTPKVWIEFPFNRFYMEESKALPAEKLYRKLSADKKKNTYALVNIKNGKAVLQDVQVDGVSLKVLVEEIQ